MGRSAATRGGGKVSSVIDRSPPQPCPVKTCKDASLQERMGMDLQEIRAYKLGKRRWSYNQVELVVCDEFDKKQLSVTQAFFSGTVPGDFAESALAYNVHLSNGQRLLLELYLVYESPQNVLAVDGELVEWKMVSRNACHRGCSGPILRSIQRFGRLGKRSWGEAPSPDVTDRTNHNMKDTRYMYLSFDEAGTHVGCRYFRLIGAAYDNSDGSFLASTVSPPIRVLSNNDVPTGSAHIQLYLSLPTSWSGWEPCLTSTSQQSNPLEMKLPIAKRARRAANSNGSSEKTTLQEEEEDVAEFSSANHANLASLAAVGRQETEPHLQDSLVEIYDNDGVLLAQDNHQYINTSKSVPPLVPDFKQGFRLVHKSDQHLTEMARAGGLNNISNYSAGGLAFPFEDDLLEERILDAISYPAYHFTNPSISNSDTTNARLHDDPLSLFVENIMSRSQVEPPVVILPEDGEGRSGLLLELYNLQYNAPTNVAQREEPTGFLPVVRQDYRPQQLQGERRESDVLQERLEDGGFNAAGTVHFPLLEHTFPY